ncbi:hypothetical protein RJT34_30513 [Clitoria ternatea]|uniref:Uncharacterized protein n=1 Tax=Clitoria ternatea TaxID=43366 RepID=A0AAN9ESY1_CLITE
MNLTRKSGLLSCLFGILFYFLHLRDFIQCVANLFLIRGLRGINSPDITSNYHPEVKLLENDNLVILENGIIQVTLSNPEGTILGISYNRINNVLERQNRYNNRGYFDIVWNAPGNTSKLWGYILRRGSSGLYIYGIFERLEGFPAMEIDHIRIVFKLQEERFHYMAIADDRQRIMPTAEDRSRGQRLDYDEAVLITNPSNSQLQGEVDDKYQYSCENKDNKLHGWINFDSKSNESVGFWMITPRNEFRSGGPIKQGLTSHVGPTTLNVSPSNI